MNKNIFELLEQEQQEILAQVSSIESFGQLKEAAGITLNPCGITRETATSILKNVTGFRKEYNKNKSESKIVLSKKIMNPQNLNFGHHNENEWIKLSVTDGKVILSLNEVFMDAIKNYHGDCYKKYSVKEIFMDTFLNRMDITWAIISSVLMGAFPAWIGTWLSFPFIWVWITSTLVCFLLSAIISYRKAVNRNSKIATRKLFLESHWPSNKWDDVIFDREVKTLYGFYLSYGEDYKAKDMKEALNRLETFAYKAKGELVVLLNKKTSVLNFDPIKKKLQINGGVTFAVELAGSYVIERTSPATTAPYLMNDEIKKLTTMLNEKRSLLFAD